MTSQRKIDEKSGHRDCIRGQRSDDSVNETDIFRRDIMALYDVVIVGAGMAGLTCAQRSRQAGHTVCVLEKSRGLGGRMATRRIEGVPVDHGARYLQPANKPLQVLTKQLIAQETLTPWTPHRYALDHTGQLSRAASEPSRCYVAPDGMSAIGKAISDDLLVHRQQRVTHISPQAESTWRITAEQTDDSLAVQHEAKAIVLAIPAPQILTLLEPLKVHSSVEKMAAAIASVQYAPCITMMAQYEPPLSSESTLLPQAPSEPWEIEGHPDTPFFWIGLDSGKRASAHLNVVFHSSAAFAKNWLETPDLQPAGTALLESAANLVAPWMARPLRWQIHRWRYARVQTPCPDPLPMTPVPLPLITCGDWCGDHNIDTALEAGVAAAAALDTLLSDGRN